MNVSKQQSWERFKKFYFEFPRIGLAVDLSNTNISDEFIATMETRFQKAFADMHFNGSDSYDADWTSL